jgi:C4-dicarboxylate-specific signal transduction histidine kinase
MKRLHRLLYPGEWSIAGKISAALLSVAILPMSFTAYYNLRQSWESAENSEYRKLELSATSTASRLDQLIMDIQTVVVQVSRDADVVDFLTVDFFNKASQKSELQSSLLNVKNSHPDFDAVFLMDAEGKCLASTDLTFIGKNYRFREYFQKAIQGSPYVSSILVGETTKRPGLFFSHPVVSNKGKILGVTVLKIQGEKIWKIVNQLRGVSQSNAFLVDQHGVIISHSNHSLLYKSLNPLPKETLRQVLEDRRYGRNDIKSLNISELKPMVNATETGHAIYRLPDEQTPRIVGFAPLEKQSWVLGVSQPKTQFFLPLQNLIWQQVSNILLVGGISTIIALVLAKNISRPIRRLIGAAKDLEIGNFNPEQLTEVSRAEDDMGQLVRVFLDMAWQIKAREQKLKQEVTKLRVEIDETKRANHVAEITENEHFLQLQRRIQKLRQQAISVGESETDYYERLQQQVQSLRKTSN